LQPLHQKERPPPADRLHVRRPAWTSFFNQLLGDAPASGRAADNDCRLFPSRSANRIQHQPLLVQEHHCITISFFSGASTSLLEYIACALARRHGEYDRDRSDFASGVTITCTLRRAWIDFTDCNTPVASTENL